MIRNILFDMGGVIFRQDNEEAFRRFREIGIDTDKYMGAYVQNGFFLDVETGDIDDQEFCRQLSQTAGRKVSWEEAQYCWKGYFKDAPLERLHELLELKKHYHVCLLSNTNPFMMAFTGSKDFSAEGKPITEYFNSLFCSYEMHAHKPNKDIYLMALEADGMNADECIFVDDSKANVKAAESVGMHGLEVLTNEDWGLSWRNCLQICREGDERTAEPVLVRQTI